MPRAMTVFAHPDDETVALGARLGRLSTAHLVHVTDGAPRNEQDSRSHGFGSLEAYRNARSQELERALHLAGLDRVRSECLDIPDQQVSLCLLALTCRIFRLLEKVQPEVVFTHPYEGGHPDHDACAFAVHHAVALQRSSLQPVPLIVEAAFYHTSPTGIATGEFLEPPQDSGEQNQREPDSPGQSMRHAVLILSPEERQRKQAMFTCFTTQQETLRYFQLEQEQFRIAPAYDFRKPPHPGQVFYDQFPWGMTSQRFCELAGQAEDGLQQRAVVLCP